MKNQKLTTATATKKQKVRSLIIVASMILVPLGACVVDNIINGDKYAAEEAASVQEHQEFLQEKGFTQEEYEAWVESEKAWNEREETIDAITEATCTAVNESGGVCY